MSSRPGSGAHTLPAIDTRGTQSRAKFRGRLRHLRCARFLLSPAWNFAMRFDMLEKPSVPCASKSHVPEPHTHVPHAHAIARRACAKDFAQGRESDKNFASFLCRGASRGA
jgi:hypothetical protein